tara:strand:+ start:21 stop:368 length:348 start_codon:yes stop_codon:yes gene_type:complete
MTITDVKGNEFVKEIPKVVDVIPCGSRILVELLKPDEIIGTNLHIGENVKVAPQGIILKIGPTVNPEDWGFKVGDRIIVSGTGTQVENSSCVAKKAGRDVTLIEPSSIKAILVEG